MILHLPYRLPAFFIFIVIFGGGVKRVMEYANGKLERNVMPAEVSMRFVVVPVPKQRRYPICNTILSHRIYHRLLKGALARSDAIIIAQLEEPK